MTDTNDSKPWSHEDDGELMFQLVQGASIQWIAEYLCRSGTVDEVRKRAEGMGWRPAVETTDVISRPAHYTSSPAKCAGCARPIECIDITAHQNFCRGNSIKYIWRAGLKGDALDDLRKAAYYINKEIERLTALRE